MEPVEYCRTIKEDEFNKVKWGYLPKQGVSVHESQKYNWREMDLSEAQIAGYTGVLTSQDVKLLIPEVINRQIITLAEDLRIGRNLLDVIRINGPSQSFLKEWGFKAYEVDEGGEVPTAQLRWEKFFINVMKTGVQPVLTYESIADGNTDIFNRHTTQATLAMVKFEDAHIMTVINAGVPDGTTIVGTREANHTFNATNNVLDWDLWVNFSEVVAIENYNITDVAMHPYQAAQMLKLSEYRELTAGSANLGGWRVQPDSRAQEVLSTGQIPPILGKKLHISPTQTPGQIVGVDKNNYAVLAERQPLLVETGSDIVRQLQRAVFTQRYGAGIMNNDCAAMITGLKTTLT